MVESESIDKTSNPLKQRADFPNTQVPPMYFDLNRNIQMYRFCKVSSHDQGAYCRRAIDSINVHLVESTGGGFRPTQSIFPFTHPFGQG